MKKSILLAAVAAMLCGSVACSTVTVVPSNDLNGRTLSTSGRSVAHINVSNTGIYFFDIPVFCGDPKDQSSMKFMSDDVVSAKSVTEMLSSKSKELKANAILDVTSTYNRSPIPFCFFLFNTRRVEMSGNAVIN